MKKMLSIVISLKSFAAMNFAGLMFAYMIAGWLYSTVKHVTFEYSIPFIFVFQGAVLAIIISALWFVLLGDSVIKKMRYYLRLILFVITLFIALSACLLVFFAIPTDWAKLWLIIAGLFVIAVAGISILGELYFMATGKRYTESLEDYKKNIGNIYK